MQIGKMTWDEIKFALRTQGLPLSTRIAERDAGWRKARNAAKRRRQGELGQRFDSVEVARTQKVVSDSLYKTMAPHRVVKIVEVE